SRRSGVCYHTHLLVSLICVFFLITPLTIELYTLSLHDALPILIYLVTNDAGALLRFADTYTKMAGGELELAMEPPTADSSPKERSEEHTSELQSHLNLVCRLLLEKKKKKKQDTTTPATTRYTQQ